MRETDIELERLAVVVGVAWDVFAAAADELNFHHTRVG